MKEKQIEEMANAINEMDEQNAHYYDENMQEHEAFAEFFRYLVTKEGNGEKWQNGLKI